jgi:hypothetical protein
VTFVKAKRILTGLPDDRKNFFSSTGAARQKNISSDMRLPNVRRAFANFAPLRLCEKLASRGLGSRKGAKFSRTLLESQLGLSNHETSATNGHEYSQKSISHFSACSITRGGLPAPGCFIIPIAASPEIA